MATDVIITPGSGEILWQDSSGTPQSIRMRGDSQNELYFTSDSFTVAGGYFAFASITPPAGTGPLMVLQDSTTGLTLAPGYNVGFSLGTSTFRWMPFFSATNILGDLTIGQLAAPTGVTVTVNNTPGSTAYSYKVTALSSTGETLATTNTTSTGNATPNNTVTWSPINGALAYNIYGRVAGSEMLLATVQANNAAAFNGTTYSLVDSSLTIGSTSAPTMNSTGQISVGGNLVMTASAGGYGLALANVTSASVLLARAGALIYDTGSLKFYNGSSWQTVAASPTGSDYTTVQNQGSAVAQQPILNFVGDSITAVNDAANTRTTVTVNDASATQAGTVTTGAQTFAGNKTFQGGAIMTASGGPHTYEIVYNPVQDSLDIIYT